MADNLPAVRARTATGAHTRADSPVAEQSRLERKIRRSFGRLVNAAPEAAEVLIDIMHDTSQPGMVRYLSARTILSSVGLGEISKQVQKTTQEIHLQGQTRSQDETLARLNNPEVAHLLLELERRLTTVVAESAAAEGEAIEGEFEERGDQPDA